MKFLSKLFARKPSMPPEAHSAFKKIDAMLNDAAFQNAALPDAVRDLVESGADVDQLPLASGEFGHSASNPIPVNGPAGQLTYIASLRTKAGAYVLAHRLGSIGQVDVFESVSTDGAVWDILYLSLYHPRRSKQAPKGYRLLPRLDKLELTATTAKQPEFPGSMANAMREASKRVLGVPVTTRHISEALASAAFRRPPAHEAALARIF